MMDELKREINAKGIKQKAIANELGISEASFSKKIMGKCKFDVYESVNIMKILGVPVNAKNFERLFFVQKVHSECTK